MNDKDRAEIEQLADSVCPAKDPVWGTRCEQEAGHAGRHWSASVNWPALAS